MLHTIQMFCWCNIILFIDLFFLQLEEWPPADKLMKLGFLWSLTLFSGVNLVLEALEAQLVMGKGGVGGHKLW